MSGLSWLEEIWITLTLRNTFLLDVHNLGKVGKTGFEVRNFPPYSLLLKPGAVSPLMYERTSIACAFKGLENDDVEAFRRIVVRQNYLEAE